MTTKKWEPVDPIMLQDPMSVYAELRSQCPVARTDFMGGMWGIFKYEDIVQAARDTKSFANGAHPRYPQLPRVPLESDPPRHAPYRRLLQPFFAPQRMKELEPTARRIATELLEPLLDQGTVDIAEAMTYRMPVKVICALLHLPDEDWEKLNHWSEEVFISWGKDPERAKAAKNALTEYCKRLIEQRRQVPLPPGTDITSDLLAAQIDGQPLDEGVIIGALHLLMTAGHDSTTSSIGIIINYLARHLEVQTMLREQPELIPNAAEEILRLETPVQMMTRTVVQDTEISGQTLKKGDRVFLVWASGNRDEKVFENPDQFDPTRNPNQHLVFGHGIHKCLGAPLARLEIRVAIEELLSRTSRIVPAGEVIRTGAPRFGVGSLPVRLEV